MSSWTALNVEPDDGPEEVIDDTKELQIEETLKLYQNALRLHSQGPAFYAEAEQAYQALAESDVFKYPEALSDYRRDEIFDRALPGALEPAYDSIELTDASSSTLVQLINLAYKNQGQFTLDALKQEISTATQANGSEVKSDIITKTAKAMKLFAGSLERDDTDLELWRKAARIGAALQSRRLSRFCLESVLEGDNGEIDDDVNQLGLEEAFAFEDLRKLYRIIDDDISSTNLPATAPRKTLLKLMKRHADLFPSLPKLATEIPVENQLESDLAKINTSHMLKPLSRSWVQVGKSILQMLSHRQQPLLENEQGCIVKLDLADEESADETSEAGELQAQAQESAANQTTEADVDMQEAQQTDDEANALDAQLVVTDAGDIDNNSKTAGSADAEATAEPSITNEAEVPENETTREEIQQEEEVGGSQEQPSQPNRKRSITSVTNEETAEGIRSRSKRLRARQSDADALVAPAEAVFDTAQFYEDQLEIFSHADQWLFSTIGEMLSKYSVHELGTIDQLKALISAENAQSDTNSISLATDTTDAVIIRDLRAALETWNEEKAKVAAAPVENKDVDMKQQGLAIFLEHSKRTPKNLDSTQQMREDAGLSTFLRKVNARSCSISQINLLWLEGLLRPKGSEGKLSDTSHSQTTYLKKEWSESLKETVVQAMVNGDDYLYEELLRRAEDLDQHLLEHPDGDLDSEQMADVDFCLTLYELHLDVLVMITNPGSQVEEIVRISQRDRANRWAGTTGTFIDALAKQLGDEAYKNTLCLRYTWASVMHALATEGIEDEQIMWLLNGLRKSLVDADSPVLHLRNNALMPEISLSAIDQEISRRKTMGFFLSMFSSDDSDPVATIESLEPVLDPTAIGSDQETADADMTSMHSATSPSPAFEGLVSQFKELTHFLDQGDASLKLFLWRKLRNAYESIKYPTKVISCNLRSIEVIICELESESYLESSDQHRQRSLVRWLRCIDDLMDKALAMINSSDKENFKPFEIFDVEHLKASMTAIARLSRILHSFALYEDSIRVGQSSLPDGLGAQMNKSSEKFKQTLRDMQVRAWVLQLLLIREAALQESGADLPPIEVMDYLRSVHNAMGIRSYCKYAGRALIQIIKKELPYCQNEDGYATELAQVLFDLHGLKCSSQPGDLADHGCTTVKLDRPTAIKIVDFVLMLAKRVNIKDLAKTDLKIAIDTIQSVIGSPKSSPGWQMNKRHMNLYLKSPVNPIDLFRCVKGIGEIAWARVVSETATIAQKGWYFLLGNALLVKFRSQKRISAAPTDDLDLALVFFRQSIEHDPENWETWYRLAQVYDSKIEEDITWSAEKINNHRGELANLQRCAIHCYTMAVAIAMRSADADAETALKMSDMFSDFGMRMYASSREPLSMDAFKTDTWKRHFTAADNKMYEAPQVKEMRIYSVWKFAAYMFEMASNDRPELWKYVLCFWISATLNRH